MVVVSKTRGIWTLQLPIKKGFHPICFSGHNPFVKGIFRVQVLSKKKHTQVEHERGSLEDAVGAPFMYIYI